LTVAVLIFVLIVILTLTLTALLGRLLLVGLLIPGLAAVLTLSLLTLFRLVGLTNLLIFVFGIVCHENLQAKHGSPRTLKFTHTPQLVAAQQPKVGAEKKMVRFAFIMDQKNNIDQKNRHGVIWGRMRKSKKVVFAIPRCAERRRPLPDRNPWDRWPKPTIYSTTKSAMLTPGCAKSKRKYSPSTSSM